MVTVSVTLYTRCTARASGGEHFNGHLNRPSQGAPAGGTDGHHGNSTLPKTSS